MKGIYRQLQRFIAVGQSASLATNLNNSTSYSLGVKVSPGKYIQGTNEEIEGLCPPGALWCRPCAGRDDGWSENDVRFERKSKGNHVNDWSGIVVLL